MLADGVRFPINGSVIIGRNPTQSQFPGATILAVPDPTLTLSKTHARFEVRGGALLVEDLGSTNGVAVLQAGKRELTEVLPPFTQHRVGDGDRIELGEYPVVISWA